MKNSVNLSPINQLHESENKWFAVYTKYKCEKYVSENLIKKGIDTYLPIITKTKKYERKIKQYHVPLINCYVFVNIVKYQYVATLETEYVMKFLKQGKDLIAIPDNEMNMLKRVAGDIIEVNQVEQSTYTIGENVEVISGHLAGLRGKIVSKEGKKSFLVELESIGFQFRLKIDLNLLKPIGVYQLIA